MLCIRCCICVATNSHLFLFGTHVSDGQVRFLVNTPCHSQLPFAAWLSCWEIPNREIVISTHAFTHTHTHAVSHAHTHIHQGARQFNKGYYTHSSLPKPKLLKVLISFKTPLKTTLFLVGKEGLPTITVIKYNKRFSIKVFILRQLSNI